MRNGSGDQTNLNAVFFCTTAAIPIMVEQKYGRIITISSVNGQTGAFGQANYAASKGGIITFTKTLALELAKSGVTANVVAPGFTLTDMLSKVPENVQDQIKARIPLAALACPKRRRKPRCSWLPTATTSLGSRSMSTAARICRPAHGVSSGRLPMQQSLFACGSKVPLPFFVQFPRYARKLNNNKLSRKTTTKV